MSTRLASANALHSLSPQISRPEDWQHKPTPKKFFVYFYGTEEMLALCPTTAMLPLFPAIHIATAILVTHQLIPYRVMPFVVYELPKTVTLDYLLRV